jgi:hypothetical protein
MLLLGDNKHTNLVSIVITENSWNFFFLFPTQIVILGFNKFRFSAGFWTEWCYGAQTDTKMHTKTGILAKTGISAETDPKTEIFRSLI